MIEFTSRVPPKPAPSRRKRKRAIILTVCAAFVLMAFVCCYAVTVVVAAVLNGVGAIFNGLAESIGAFISTLTVFLVVVVFPLLMDLLSLLAAGQLIPFAMRFLHLLSSF
jgi:hypothetical protein